MSKSEVVIDELLKSAQSQPNIVLFAQELIQQIGGYEALAAMAVQELHNSTGTSRATLLRSVIELIKSATEKTPRDPTADLSREDLVAVLERLRSNGTDA